MKFKNVLTYLIIFTNIFYGQSPKINKVEPPNWWSGHSFNKIQLMIYGENLAHANLTSLSNKINVTSIPNKNNNYLFAEIEITNSAEPNYYNFLLTNKFGVDTIKYQLFERNETENIHQGFSTNDVIYLIFPDRFVNGDTSNDFIFNNSEEFKFNDLNGRHGGDIQGIINKLDYLKDLGISAIWITPLTENNMSMSYHGYSCTDLYKIDPRFGTNELYKKLVYEAHKRGIKIILDHVANHIGSNHEWIKNPPTPTWINGTVEKHLPAEHDKVIYVDIHADKSKIANANKGWFVDTMPDLNQTDSLLAEYIIQNTIWWIEYSGLDGIREDTYPYSDQNFMSIWAETILQNYPKLNIVGEVWKGDPAVLAKFQTKNYFPKEIDSNLPVVTDFAIRDVLYNYMEGKTGLLKIYETFGQDFVYSNPDNLLTFFDNHDTDRGMYAAKWNMEKFKKALIIVLTTRGVPQIFYGTEIGLDGGGHHGKIREEFPGGFPNDSLNAFFEDGRNSNQNEIYNFTKKLLNLRKQNKALREGKFVQYCPKDDIYVYKKVLENVEIVIFLNDKTKDNFIDLGNYTNDDDLNNMDIKNLLDENLQKLVVKNNIILPGNSISIWEIKHIK
ncbi:MAG: cyclomaltodextrinase N-terminal domain-containing protein [Ignavibacteriales bacterium]|nr:cyclomaltodextrinase N-terminal domain-containing protein [Ignavibacteriales bacterium]